MRRKTIIWLLVCSITALLVLISSCATAQAPAPAPGKPPAAPAAEKPIKIGGLFEMTGFLSQIGAASRQGVFLALEKAGNKVGNRPIEFIVEDMGSDVNMTMDKVRKLVEVDGVSVIVGPIFGAAQEAMAGYLDKVQVPDLTFAPSTDGIPINNKWTFLAAGTHQQATYPSGLYAGEVMGFKTATTLASDFVGGHDFIEGFTLGFEQKGGKVIQNQWSPPGATDFNPFFLAMKPADVIVAWWAGAENFPGLKQYRELGIKMPLLQPEDGGVTADPSALKEVGAAARGLTVAAIYAYTINTPGNKEFVQAYQSKWGVLPGPFGGAGYTTMQLALEGIRLAGNDTSPKAIKEGLLKVNMDTPRGRITFSPDRVASFTTRILKIDDNLVPQVVKYYALKTEKVGNKIVISLAQ